MSKPMRRFLVLLALLLASTGAGANTLIFIAVTPALPTLHIGIQQQFTATGTYDDNTTQDITRTVTWSSSSPVVMTISNAAGSQGLAVPITAGFTTITATLGPVSGSTAGVVDTGVLVSLAVSPPDGNVQQAQTLQFQAEGTFSDGSTVDLTDAVTWTTSNTAVAAISNATGSQGLATAIAPGTTTITATTGLISGSTGLDVTAPLNSVHVDDGQAYASYGKLIEYTVTLRNENGVAPSTTAVAGTLSAGFDISQAHWQCVSVANIPCAQQGTGALVDSVTLSQGESAVWLVAAPVMSGTAADTVEFDVAAEHAVPAADVDVLTVFRDGFE